MSILELQRRLREIGRIRLGVKVMSHGKMRPAKLDRFRLTSRDGHRIAQVADLYGGTPEPWDDAPDERQWQVIVEADAIPVLVPPASMAFSQSYEQWSAGGCRVRCDGERDVIGDVPCHCDPSARACAIHTRLSLMLPEVPGLGVWRLDTQGWYAAQELAGIVEVLAMAAERGQMIPGRLLLEQRSAKRIDPSGKPITLRYAVPVLDADVAPSSLGIGSATSPALPRQSAGGAVPQHGEDAGRAPARRLTPVPPADAALVPSVADQLAATTAPEPPSRRPLPPRTGLVPRTAAQVAADEPADIVNVGPAVAEMRAKLNALGTSARRAFLDRFGVVPQEVPAERVTEAQSFVETLTREAARPASSEAAEAAEVPGSEADERTPEPGAAQESGLPDHEPPEPHPAVVDVARKAGVVFRPDYEAAPKRSKTRTVDRLRHALTYAVTGKVSLNDLDAAELVRVWQRLEDVTAGRLTYVYDRDDDKGVTWTMRPADGTEPTGVTVLWAELEEENGA